MKILHYSLGFPPYRSGGMTKFCVDLMQEQRKEGYEVTLLWPGQINHLGRSVRIKQHKSVNGIGSLEIINPLPISYDEGISDIEAFTKSVDAKPFEELLKEYNPDVIHIHTLMGLHREFIEAAKKLGIRTAYTTHDFFAFCPKVTMFRDGAFCSEASSCSYCSQCNSTAMPMNMIVLMQSGLYRALKDNPIVKKLRKQHRDDFLGEKSGISQSDEQTISDNEAEKYKTLRSYYVGMLKNIDIIHFNSTITKNIYEQFMDVKKSVVIPISHADIKDRKRIKNYSSDTLHLTYLGAQSQAKGYFLLTDALDQLWIKRQDFCLNVFFVPSDGKPYINAHGRYDYSQLPSIMDQTDVLIVPSIWPETFGYTVLEALSFGVPVIISDMVGAKEILAEGCGIVISDITAEKLSDSINDLTPVKLSAMNRAIVDHQEIQTIEAMAEDINNKCYMK
ncbi:MAG: glycosyltransferase [Catonella sp.]|nr:glycosyltransferase [Catonella sp.]